MKLCECGCGNPAPLAKETRTLRGYRKGEPIRFIFGHQRKGVRFPLHKRFWSKVNKRGPIVNPKLGRCWVWSGSTRMGYGQFQYEKRYLTASRVAWFLKTGQWPTLFCLHKCDNPPCVRFSHLFEGTQKTNLEDMTKKGRGRNAYV